MDKITEKERSTIDIATLEQKIAELNLENASLKLRTKILELYLNYGLTQNHIIDREGNIKLKDQKEKNEIKQDQ